MVKALRLSYPPRLKRLCLLAPLLLIRLVGLAEEAAATLALGALTLVVHALT